MGNSDISREVPTLSAGDLNAIIDVACGCLGFDSFVLRNPLLFSAGFGTTKNVVADLLIQKQVLAATFNASMSNFA